MKRFSRLFYGATILAAMLFAAATPPVSPDPPSASAQTSVRYDDLPDVAEFVVEGRKWDHTNLTYFFQNGTFDINGDDERQAVRDAFALWASVTSLTFTEVSSASSADIVILWASGDHGDGSPFDGMNGVLAHAFFPPPNGGSLAGDAHFDDGEIWTLSTRGDSSQPIDLVTVAAHEIGHSLGLAHSQVEGALMAPFYTGSHRFLAQDDIDGIQTIYPPNNPSGGVTDLVGIKKSNTGSGTTEVHMLSGESNYQQYLLNAATPLHITDDTWDFETADWNLDGRPDIIGIKKSNTDSFSTEVHILSGATNFQTFILHAATPLHITDDTWDFAAADWNRDGRPDLIGVKKSNTGTNSTEVHILSGAANFQTFILHAGTPLHPTDRTWDFEAADWDFDGRPELIGIKKSGTDTGKTEVHMLSGAANFQQFLYHTATSLHPTDDTWDFEVGDWNADGRPDLIGVKKSGTGTGKTEVHILSGATNFLQFLLNAGTAEPPTDDTWDFEAANW